jgi:hypothetical protein
MNLVQSPQPAGNPNQQQNQKCGFLQKVQEDEVVRRDSLLLRILKLTLTYRYVKGVRKNRMLEQAKNRETNTKIR